jgi:hypothetical protein
MANRHVTDLVAARRYTSNVLLHLDVSGHDLTVARFQELLDYFTENPTEYLEIINDTY